MARTNICWMNDELVKWMNHPVPGCLFHKEAAFKPNAWRELSEGWIIQRFNPSSKFLLLPTTTTSSTFIPGPKFRDWCSMCFSSFGGQKENLFPIQWSFTDTCNTSRIIMADQPRADPKGRDAMEAASGRNCWNVDRAGLGKGTTIYQQS